MKQLKTKLLTAALLSGIFLFYGFQGDKSTPKWYKGNLHCHSYWSDGDAFPEVVMEWYKSHGYQFISLTDHNILAEGEKWKLIPDNETHLKAFGDYRAKYGPEWVKFSSDTGRFSVRLKTLEEYKSLFEEKNKFLILPSEEISDGIDKKPVHLCAANIRSVIPPQKGGSVTEVMQNDINAVLHQEKETGLPMMVQINHPNFHFAITTEDIIPLEGARFLEVYNGHPQVYNYGDETHPGTETMWDQINLTFARKGKPLLLAVATDDTHSYHVQGIKSANPGRGWVMVKAEELTTASLIEAMKRGDFYASTGVTLKEVSFRKNRLKISVQEEPGVNYKVQFIGCKKADGQVSVLKEAPGGKAVFEVDRDILFVRAKIVSDKMKENPFREGDREVAWCQPVIPE